MRLAEISEMSGIAHLIAPRAGQHAESKWWLCGLGVAVSVCVMPGSG